MLECNNRFEDRAFLLMLAGVSLAFLWMLRPFFDVIFWGIVIALLSTPVYDALQRRSMGRNLAALTCVILSLVLIIVPCAYIFYTFINEVANLYGRLTSGGHDIRETLEKLREEAGELEEAVREDTNVAEELGDLLFAAVNVARFVKVDPEDALSVACDKFARRFRQVEASAAAQGKTLDEMTLAEMDRLWDEAKKQEA